MRNISPVSQLAKEKVLENTKFPLYHDGALVLTEKMTYV